MPVSHQNQNGDVAARFTVYLAAGDDQRIPATTDSVKLMAHVSPEGDGFAAIMDGLELEDSNGNPFLAIVSGLELRGGGSTAARAQDDLVRAMRSWLERQDTIGRLAASLCAEDLSEETEVTLRFVDPEEADRLRSGMSTAPPPRADRIYDAQSETGVSVYTFRG